MSSSDIEKDVIKGDTGKVFVSSPVDTEDYYDPSKESVWTRAGLNFESFKRAPGSTR